MFQSVKTNTPDLFSLSTQMPEPLKVSALVNILKKDVEKNHQFVRVIGELSSLKKWRSGHWYFDIKDESALLPGVMFRPDTTRLKFEVADGMEVLFAGKVSIYPATSRLQMIVESMEPLGQGALALAFEQLKAKLLQEGLFSAPKKPLKLFNPRIGIVTSPQGAVLRDMARIIRTKAPGTAILLAPVRVQGVGAREEIAAAIELLDRSGLCDVIIVARGGGSLEDLWAFNEEIVARAIFAANTPIVSAIGHETDTTISDFVSDFRAATPTHAAQMVALDVAEELLGLSNLQSRLTMICQGYWRNFSLLLATAKKSLADPRLVLLTHWQELDGISHNLHRLTSQALSTKFKELQHVQERLAKQSVWQQLKNKRENLFAAQMRLMKRAPQESLTKARHEVGQTKVALSASMTERLLFSRHQFQSTIGRLEALSPLKVLARGYAVVTEVGTKRLLTSVRQIKPRSEVAVRLSDGVLTAAVNSTEIQND
jgi:exodeoxyribonuclease VII large subunit